MTPNVMPAAGEPTPARFANPLLRLLAATRPPFLLVTLTGCLIGIASAHADGVPPDALLAALTILAALSMHAGGNVLNDYYDARSGADAANSGRIFPYTGGSRFIQNGVLTTRATALLGWGLLAAAIPPGLWLALHSGPVLLAIGAAGLLLAWAYTAPPFQLVSRGLGELAVAACWLLVVVGADCVQRGTLAWTPVAAGVSFALLVAALLYINQFPDHDGDAVAGKRTLVVRLGPERAKWGYFAIVVIAYGWLILQVGRESLPQVAAGAAIAIVLSLNAARELREHASDPARLGRGIRLTIGAALIHGVLLAALLAFNWR